MALDSMDLDHVLVVHHDRPEHTPSQRMQLAALEDACRVLQSGGRTRGCSPEDYARDVAWVEGRCVSVPGFSLEDVCASLSLDHSRVRDLLLSLVRQEAVAA